MERPERHRLVAGATSLLALAVLTVATLLTIGPPSPEPADAPVEDFSAGRAAEHVQSIGGRVHPAGSPAAGDVRSYIVEQLAGLGLDPEVTDAVGMTDALGGQAMARVRNVVATLPGADSTGRLFLVAHYDSVQVSYGANDDGSGVATLLETARALTDGPALRNDVVLLFTDAEEACLCGAEAFVHNNPLAADGGVVLNFESRGANGPAIMFETSVGNADLVARYAAAVPYPVATSMAVEVYRILPNDTDFTPFRESDRFTGLNTAYIDGSAVYHSPQDRPENLDLGSLQHQGSNALALTRELGSADLGTLAVPGGGDATYFPVLGTLVMYPGWLVWPLAALAALAVAALAVQLVRRQRLGGPRVAAGFGLAVVPLLLAPLGAQAVWYLLTLLRPGYAAMLDPWRPGWYRAGIVALVALIVVGWFTLLRRRIGPAALVVGGLGWLAVLGIALAAVTPGGSYLAAVPALAVAATANVALLVRQRWIATAVLTVGAAVAVCVLAPTVTLFFPALGLATGAAAAVMAVLLGVALLPVLVQVYPLDAHPVDRLSRRWSTRIPALVCAATTVGFLVVGWSVDRFDERHPEPTQLMYALDTDTGTAQWVTEEDDPGDWTAQYVDHTADLSADFPLLDGELATGPAQPAPLEAPTVHVDADSTVDGRRTLTLTVHPQRQARLVDISAADATVLGATVRGRPMPVADSGFHLLFHAPPPDGLTFTLELDGDGPVDLRVMDGSDGLAGLPGFRPRPPGVGVQGSHTSELVLVARTVTV